jgi:hypothetical protein
MMILRCTQSLLKHLGEDGSPDTSLPTTRLGAWYAKLFVADAQMLIVAVSERSLLPVFITAENLPFFPLRLRQAIRSVLWTIGVSPNALAQELREMVHLTVGRSVSRSVLGSMNRMALEAQHLLSRNPNMNLSTLAIELAETPCPALKHSNPKSVTLALLG